MVNRRTGRFSLRDQMRAANAADRYYAAAHDAEPQAQSEIAEPRAYKRGPDPTEHEIQNAVIEYLLVHPKVALVTRFNSGAMQYENADGSRGMVRFHRIYYAGVRIVDLDVMLTGGMRCVIEVKRPPWTRPVDKREREQFGYIQLMRSLGCRGGFALSIEHAEEIVNGGNGAY